MLHHVRIGFLRGFVVLGCLALPISASHAQVQDMLPSKEAVSARVNPDAFSPYAGRNFPTQVFWGDTHTHTQVSVDAGTMTTMTQ